MQRAVQLLNNTFGYSAFRHHQADIIQSLLHKQDVLVLMPTGGGKSLCYQIPSMLLDGTGIVISPLIALMQDQVVALKQLGIRAALLNSSLDHAEQQLTEKQFLNGELDLLYISPERLLTPRTLDLLARSNIALFAIDEAHCVSQWGHDFRKEYQQLGTLHEQFADVPRIALTATADARTRDEIIQQLKLDEASVFINSFDRPNIRYTISEGNNSRDQLWQFLQENHPEDAGIVYCLSRKKVENITEWLNARGRTALPYHAGLSTKAREKNQQRFQTEEGIIIVATIAFGMGIDKPDVRFVAHLSLPKSVEAYYQETGRAGRDGAAANAWMSYGIQDVIMLKQMMQETDATEQFKRISHQKLEAMLGLCEQTSCRRQTILAYFGETDSEACGNCDTCLNPPQTWDATQASRMALSCVHRTGQRFGINYVIDVLRGKDDDRIKQNRHDKTSTFGIGKDLSIAAWRSIFRQLLARNYIYSDLDAYGALKLTEQARPLLRGEIELMLRQQQKLKQDKPVPVPRQPVVLQDIDMPLFNALREHRLSIAQDQGVPPYFIFHDSTLQEMAFKRPENPDQLRHITGVGDQKLKKFGESFLHIISTHPCDGIQKQYST